MRGRCARQVPAKGSPPVPWPAEKAVCYDTLVARPFLFLFLLVSFCAGAASGSGSVVVLPLMPDIPDPRFGWIGESSAETLADLLSRNRIFVLDREERLRVSANLGVTTHPNRTLATNLKIAMELEADKAVFGSFRIAGPEELRTARIHLSLSVMDLRRWRPLADIQVEGLVADLGLVETRAAYLVLKALSPDEDTDEATFLSRYPQVRLDAREYYIRGLLAETGEASHRYFTQAVRLEESYAAPVFQLALQYWERRNYQQAAEWLERIGPEFPRFREVQFMLGVCRASLGRYEQAEQVLRALYADAPLPEVANNLAVVISRRHGAGVLELLLFAVDQEPDDPDYRFNLGHALWMRERYEDAAERFREALELAENDAEATRMLGRSLQGEASRPARTAVENLNRLKEDFNDTVLTALGSSPVRTGAPVLPEVGTPVAAESKGPESKGAETPAQEAVEP
jgi:tetratricopeptide (TPR) repeat protein